MGARHWTRYSIKKGKWSAGPRADGAILDRFGHYRAFVSNGAVFDYHSHFLGGLQDGYFRDRDGKAVGFLPGAKDGPPLPRTGTVPPPQVTGSEPVRPAKPLVPLRIPAYSKKWIQLHRLQGVAFAGRPQVPRFQLRIVHEDEQHLFLGGPAADAPLRLDRPQRVDVVRRDPGDALHADRQRRQVAHEERLAPPDSISTDWWPRVWPGVEMQRTSEVMAVSP